MTRNQWTGGQFSLVRAILGVYLMVHFLTVAAAGTGPAAVTPLLAAAAGALLALGWYQRLAALALCAVSIDMGIRGVLPASWLLPLVGLLLLVACLPPAPYGSWPARRRIDPDGGWRMPQGVAVAFRILAIGTYAAALVTGTAPAALILLPLFAIDPGWIAGTPASAIERIFYDGSCGLCHGAVRFVLAEERRAAPFHFAPLDSQSFRHTIPPARRASLPDSLVVLTDDGRILTRSSGVLHVMFRLGGLWRLLAELSRVVPAPVLDSLYDGVARVRRRLFPAPPEACPLMPLHLRSRFEA